VRSLSAMVTKRCEYLGGGGVDEVAEAVGM
jgi:hypothetical protein